MKKCIEFLNKIIDSFKFDGRERKNNAVNHQNTAYGKGFGVPEVIRTPDLSLRRRSLYPAELRKRIQELFSFEPSQDSNELLLRRRTLYPAELRKHLLYPTTPRAKIQPRRHKKDIAFCLAPEEFVHSVGRHTEIYEQNVNSYARV